MSHLVHAGNKLETHDSNYINSHYLIICILYMVDFDAYTKESKD